MSPVVVAALVAVVVVALVVGAQVFGDVFSTRTKLLREQRTREDYAAAQNRAREYYERDIDLIASIFDPLGLFH